MSIVNINMNEPLNSSIGDIFYDSDGICNMFDGKEWKKLYAYVSKNIERMSSIESIFSHNIIKNIQ
jgi:hypothetical protein